MSRKSALFGALAVAILNGFVLLPLPLELQAFAAYLLAVPVTGALAVIALRLQGISDWPEQALLSFGIGYSLAIFVMLLISYLPGGLEQWYTLLAFDLLAVLLIAASVLRRQPPVVHTDGSDRPEPAGRSQTVSRGWLWLGILSIVVTASLLRLPGLDYSEFQDDEVSVVWHSAEVIQGRADALFIHDKGPAEILITSAVYSIANRLNESSARAPFAIANIVALLAVFWLGWRLFGPVAGWAAAIVLAVDGYFIGFARIVQYQSIVFLMIVLAVGLLYRYVEEPRARPVFAYLAGLFFATGFLAHYEAVMVVVPACYLAVRAVQLRSATLRSARHIAGACLLTLLPLLLFYVPFAAHPRFQRTFTEITGNRIGSGFPYNNLADFFTRTIIYSSTYYFAFLVVCVTIALVLVYRKTLPAWMSWAAGLALVFVLGMYFVNPSWAEIGGQDYAWLVFVLALSPALLGRRVAVPERMAWLWFASALILALFFIQKPRTHVYDFFIPMALIVGNVIGLAWNRLDGHLGRPKALTIALPTATVLTLVFAVHGYWFFVRNDIEALRTWDENRPVAYWTPLAEPRQNAIFGFPFKNGWKVVGALYAEGRLDAPFARNGKRGVANWYTRGAGDCSRDAEYYVFTPWNEPTNKGLTSPPRRPTVADGYQLIHVISVNGEARLEIFERNGTPVASPQVHDVADYESRFDSDLSEPRFEMAGVAAWTAIEHPLDFQLDDNIRLVGYTLPKRTVRAGERVELTLYWQADSAPTTSYKVFTQVIDPATFRKAGQRDGIPGCERYPTDRWLPGELIVDRYSIVIEEDAPTGDFTLLIGMYDSDGERLDFFSPDGQPRGDALGIDTITVVD